MVQEITNFELQYDGMYHINWSDGDKDHEWYVFISIPELLRMLEIEGLTFAELIKPEYQYNPMKFSKVTLRCTLHEGHFVAYGFFDEYLGNTLKENFIVELFKGDSIKNHKHDAILGKVELVDDKYNDEWQKAVNPNFSK